MPARPSQRVFHANPDGIFHLFRSAIGVGQALQLKPVLSRVVTERLHTSEHPVQASAAVMVASNNRLSDASRASTVVLAGAVPGAIHDSQTAFIAAKSLMSRK